jgi:hypothetical protein
MSCECWYAYIMGVLTWTAFTSGAVAAGLRIVLPEKAYFATMTAVSITGIMTKIGVTYLKNLIVNGYDHYTQTPLTVSSNPEHIPAAVMRKPRTVEVPTFEFSHEEEESKEIKEVPS